MRPIAVVLLLVWLLQCCGLRFSRLPTLRTSAVASTRLAAPAEVSVGTEIHAICKEDFPTLDQTVHKGKRLVYLDSAASSQKPKFVLDRMEDYYKTSHSNVHRGAHALAARATDLFESARYHVQRFVNAQHREEIVFTKGATDAVNLVAMSWGQRLSPGDEIVLTVAEHHANLVPWQMLAQRTGAVLRFVTLTENMELDLDQYKSLLSERTKLVAFSHVSNVLGAVNPVREMTDMAHAVGAVVLLDACQSVPHMPVDVQELQVDFLVASAHKMCGPTGIGFLYGRKALLESMPPVFGGGEMIETVELPRATIGTPPGRVAAGPPPIAEAVGLGAACEYLNSIGMQRIHDHETRLGAYLYNALAGIDQLQLYGPALKSRSERTGLVSFNAKTVHAADLGFFLDQEGVAVRTGSHCAQPLHKQLGAAGSVRASLYFYNSQAEVDVFVQKLRETLDMFGNL
jgi:cysteine desulfurase/selenocysteine lyase